MTVPLRDSSDPNASADINDLQSQIKILLSLSADKFTLPTSVIDPAPLNNDVGTNVKDYLARSMDGSTDEGCEYLWRVPEGLGTGNIIIEWYGYSAAASPSGTVAMSIKMSAVAGDGTESWDTAYGSTQTSTAVTFDTQDRIEKLSKTVAITTLGISAGDLVKIQTWNDVSEGTMTDDFEFVHMVIRKE